MSRFVAKLLIFIGLVGVSCCAVQVNLGNAEVTVPDGWAKSNSNRERINFTSADERQQATISIMTLDAEPSFADFKRICAHRLEAEKAQAPDISINDDAPFEDAGTFGMFFSGEEASSGRLFSGYVSQKREEVVTVYVESVGIDRKKHLESFEAFVKGLKRR